MVEVSCLYASLIDSLTNKNNSKKNISINPLQIIFIKIVKHLYKRSSMCSHKIKMPIRVCDLDIHYNEGHCIIIDYNHFRANI